MITRLGKDGMGEALILNAPVGRVLNTVMRAEVGLYSSSRANGDYKGTFSGVPAVELFHHGLLDVGEEVGVP